MPSSSAASLPPLAGHWVQVSPVLAWDPALQGHGHTASTQGGIDGGWLCRAVAEAGGGGQGLEAEGRTVLFLREAGRQAQSAP